MITGAIVDSMTEAEQRLNDLYCMMEMAEALGEQLYGEGSTMNYLGMLARTVKTMLEEIQARTDEVGEALISAHEDERRSKKPLPEGTQVHFPGAETTGA